jgi:hypothetical protein
MIHEKNTQNHGKGSITTDLRCIVAATSLPIAENQNMHITHNNRASLIL